MKLKPLPILSLWFTFTQLPSVLLAVPTNATFDDENGDSLTGRKPIYIPAGAWSQGNGCGRCNARPDGRLAEAGTWHDGTHFSSDTTPLTVNMDFTGSAIYVFFILANEVPDNPTITPTLVNFFLNGNAVGSFTHEPRSGDTSYDYNTLVYSNTTMPTDSYQLSIVADGPRSSLVLFDYALYTYDSDSVAGTSTTSNPTPTGTNTIGGQASQTTNSGETNTDDGSITNSDKRSSTNVGAIAGGVVGAVLGLVAIAAIFLYFRRIRGRSDMNGHTERGIFDEPARYSVVPQPYSVFSSSGTQDATGTSDSDAASPRDHTVPSDSQASTSNLLYHGTSTSPETPVMTSIAPPSTIVPAPVPLLPRKAALQEREQLQNRVQQMQRTVDELTQPTRAPTLAGDESTETLDPAETQRTVVALQAEIARLNAELGEERYQRGDYPPAY